MIFCWSLYVLCFAFLNAWISERNLWCPIGHSSERQFRFVISYIVSYSQSFSYSDDVLDKKYRFYLFLFLLIPGLRRSFVSIQPAYSIASIFFFSFDTDPFLSWKNRLPPSFILHRLEISVYCISTFGFHHRISFSTTVLWKFHGSIHHAQQYGHGWVHIFQLSYSLSFAMDYFQRVFSDDFLLPL